MRTVYILSVRDDNLKVIETQIFLNREVCLICLDALLVQYPETTYSVQRVEVE